MHILVNGGTAQYSFPINTNNVLHIMTSSEFGNKSTAGYAKLYLRTRYDRRNDFVFLEMTKHCVHKRKI